jgi:hypothetical protein
MSATTTAAGVPSRADSCESSWLRLARAARFATPVRASTTAALRGSAVTRRPAIVIMTTPANAAATRKSDGAADGRWERRR